MTSLPLTETFLPSAVPELTVVSSEDIFNQMSPDDFGPSGEKRIMSSDLAYVMASYSYDSELERQNDELQLRHAQVRLEHFRLLRQWGKCGLELTKLRAAEKRLAWSLFAVCCDQYDAAVDYLENDINPNRLV